MKHIHPRRTAMLAAILIAGLADAAAPPTTTAASPPSAAAAAAAAPGALPGNSLYRLDLTLTDAAGQRFYGDCNAACPIIIETLKRTVETLGHAAKPLKVLLVSLDPLHDSPEGLALQIRMHKLDSTQFRLAVARDETQTRTLASALNIKFRTLDSGDINHTTRIVLLDAAGTQQASSSRLDAAPNPAFVRQIAALLKTAKTGSDQGIPK
jgi:protein SCO1/2